MCKFAYTLSLYLSSVIAILLTLHTIKNVLYYNLIFSIAWRIN